MKHIILYLLILFSPKLFSQDRAVIKELEECKNDSVRIDILTDFYNLVFDLEADSAKYYYIRIKNIAKKQNSKITEAINLSQMGYYLFLHGDLPQGLNLNHEALRLAESVNNNIRALGMITFSQQYFTRDVNKRIKLIRQALTYSTEANDQKFMTYEYRNLGHIYHELKNTDSAFFYYQKAYAMGVKTKSAEDIAGGLTGLGRTHYLVGNKKISLEYLKSAAEIANNKNYLVRVAIIYEIAQFFKKENNIDSSIYYANISYQIANSSKSVRNIVRPASILKDIYIGINSDSALKYTNIYFKGMDSMYGRNKVEQIQGLNFAEELRQQKMEEEKQKINVERKTNLQYAAIALGLIIFVIVFLLLSHSFIVNQRFIKFLGILTLLIVFEFINLFLHPYLDRFTGHSPILMLGILVGIAALLIPLHHRLEKWITERLVEKNRRIRLEAARKTVATLETKNLD